VSRKADDRALVGEVLSTLHDGIVRQQQDKAAKSGKQSDDPFEALSDEEAEPDGGARARASEDEGLSSAAQREQIAELRRRNAEQLQALQAAHDERMALAQQEAAGERANREAILASQMEVEHRAAEYGDLSYQLQELLEAGYRWLDFLNVNESMRDGFGSGCSIQLHAPKSATETILNELRAHVVSTTEIVEGLQARAESDGLFYAIYRLCDAHRWPRGAPAQLAKRINESGASMADFARERQRNYVQGGAYEPVKYARLVEWLEENGVQYTPEAMAYLLQSMGTSTEEQQHLYAAVDIDTWVRAFREHENIQPLVVAPTL